MGYTHHFSNDTATDEAWSAFTDEARAILSHPNIASIVAFESDRPDEPPLVDDQEVRFNGRGEEGHETFLLTRGAHNTWCKTGGPYQSEEFGDQWGKSYDLAVCTVLLAARHLGEKVSSDGDWEEPGWQQARRLYAQLTGHIPRCPWKTKQCAQCSRVFKAEGHSWGGSTICARCGAGSFRGGPAQNNPSKWVMTCMDCGSTKQKKQAPTSLCYYCSHGCTDKADAKQKLRTTWHRVLGEITKVKKSKGRHLKAVDDPPEKKK